MDTNTKIQSGKQVVRVQVMDLDKTGYGPEGAHTREAWRQECKEKLLAGKSVFEAWQNSWKHSKNNSLPNVSLGITLHYADGTCTQSGQYQGFKPDAFDFSGQIFDEAVSAYECIFENHAYFTAATFAKTGNFHAAKFNGLADFNLTFFEETADFREASFAGNAYFNDAIFVNYVIFIEVIFNGRASFSSVTFREKALFHNSKFNKDAHFTNTTFKLPAIFRLATFLGDANFRGAWFLGDAQFFKAHFLNQCRFDVKLGELNEMDNWIQLHRFTRFEGLVNFENAEIENVGHFECTEFDGEIPNFLGVDNAKTLLVFSGDEYFNREDTTEDAIKRIGQLKRLADEQGQTDQALMFNKFELNAKRAQARIKIKSLNILQKLGNSDFWFANATALYDIFSSYGRSFTKPLKYYFGLLIVIYILALGNAVVNSPKDCEAENLRMLSDLWRDDTPCDISKTNPDDKTRLNGYRAAAEYTVYRAAGILDFSDNGKGTDAVARRLFGQSYEPGWMRFVGLVKAIASTALLFLAALGLRNKYRIK